MEIKITSCHDCPFCNNDNEFGRDQCNLSYILNLDIITGYKNQLPYDKRHDECPLENEIKIILE